MASLVMGVPRNSVPLRAKFQVLQASVKVHLKNLKTQSDIADLDTMRGILLSLIPAILTQTPACKGTVVYRPQNALIEVEEQSHDRWPGCHIEDESKMK